MQGGSEKGVLVLQQQPEQQQTATTKYLSLSLGAYMHQHIYGEKALTILSCQIGSFVGAFWFFFFFFFSFVRLLLLFVGPYTASSSSS